MYCEWCHCVEGLLCPPAHPFPAREPSPSPQPTIAPPPHPSCAEGDNRNARLVTGPAAHAVGQVATLSTDGSMIFAASRGLVLVLRTEGLAILDAVRVSGWG
jgi:hypothetical protein